MQKNNKFKPAHKTFSPSLITPTLRASICAGYSEGHQKAALYPALQHCGMTNAARGFTLIELLVVVLIISILAAAALPQYQVTVGKSRYATMKHVAQSLAQAQEVYYLANGHYATAVSDLDISFELTSSGNAKFPGGACYLGDKQIGCMHDTLNMRYMVNLQHHPVPQSKSCLVWGTMDLSDWRTKICKADTGSSQAYPNSSDGGYLVYYY